MDGSHLLLFIIIVGLLIRSKDLREQRDNWKESCKLYAEECYREAGYRQHYSGYQRSLS